MTFDLVIRNGMLVDGSGAARYRGDVGIRDGRIVEIGRIREQGRQDLDAEGLMVAPGFIDGHTHLDAQVFWDPLGTSACWHGVTSAVMGNCGFTLAPCREADADLVLRNLERAEDIDRGALLAGVRWQWVTYADYLDAVDRQPKGINYAGYVGHSALRTYVMGERAFEEEATDDDLAAMRSEVERSLRAGALGFATSRSASHRTSDDRPVASRAAAWSEVEAIVATMSGLGAGALQLANEQHADPDDRAAYQQRLLELAVGSGRPVIFVVGWAAQTPALHEQYLSLADDAARAGGRLVGQVHTREFLSVLGFKVGLPFDQLPGWRELRRRPLADQRRLLGDRVTRARLVAEAEGGTYRSAIGAEIRPPQYDAIRVLGTGRPIDPVLTDIAAERGLSPVDTIIELSIESGFDRYFVQPFANQDQDAVLAMIRHPRTVVGVSDTGAHVTQIIDSSIPTYLLSHWVRERQELTWEEAVRLLTFDPARLWGFRDRGLLVEGAAADIVVFDPQTVGPGLPDVARDLPAGALRLTQQAQGISYVVVNGEAVLDHGEHTGALPGRLLRAGAAGR